MLSKLIRVLNPNFVIEFEIRSKISSYFLLKKFLNTVKYFRTFLIGNISNFFVSVHKPIVNFGLKGLTCCFLIAQLAGCGTLMYPERRGLQKGNVDTGVVIMDGIGLFFFVIPGLIAFVVDYSTGAIYLPKTSKNSLGPNFLLDFKNIKVVNFDLNHSSNESLENIIKKETGFNVRFNQKNIRISKLTPNFAIDFRTKRRLNEKK